MKIDVNRVGLRDKWNPGKAVEVVCTCERRLDRPLYCGAEA